MRPAGYEREMLNPTAACSGPPGPLSREFASAVPRESSRTVRRRTGGFSETIFY